MIDPRHTIRARGVALITALVVVAVATTLAAGVMLGVQIWLRQAQNVRDRAQAVAVEHGAINWAMVVIQRDPNAVDHLGEEWATELPPFAVEGGLAQFVLVDAQARFNVNNLWRQNAPSQADIAVFQRLHQALGINAELATLLVDWIDPDGQPRPGGADDTDYLAQQPSYRAANQPISSIEELRLIRGFDAETLTTLAPYLTALPTPTEINANTAPALILSAVFNIPLTDAEKIAETRAGRKNGFSNPGELQKLLPAGTAMPSQGFGFKTAFFELRVTSQFGRSTRRLNALITRNGTQLKLLWKSRQLI